MSYDLVLAARRAADELASISKAITSLDHEDLDDPEYIARLATRLTRVQISLKTALNDIDQAASTKPKGTQNV